MVNLNIDNIENIEIIKAYRDFIGQEKYRQILVYKKENIIYQGNFDIIITHDSNIYKIILNSDNKYEEMFYSIFSSQYSRILFDGSCLSIYGKDKENYDIITQLY